MQTNNPAAAPLSGEAEPLSEEQLNDIVGTLIAGLGIGLSKPLVDSLKATFSALSLEKQRAADLEFELGEEKLGAHYAGNELEKAHKALANIRAYLQDFSSGRPHVLEVDIPELIDEVLGPELDAHSGEEISLNELPF